MYLWECLLSGCLCLTALRVSSFLTPWSRASRSIIAFSSPTLIDYLIILSNPVRGLQ